MGRLFIKLILFLALLPFILELSVRLFLPQQLIVYDQVYVTDYSGLGAKPAPNLDVTVNTGEGEARLLTNDKGYRIGSDLSEPPARPILALGDSYLMAMQVDYEQTMTALLEQRLSADLDEVVQIVNTGNAGAGVNHYRILLEQELEKEDYDLVLVFINSTNDYVEESIPYFKPQILRQRLLRMPQSAAPGEVINALLYPVNDWLERSSHLYILGKNRASALLAQIGLTAYYFPEELLKSEAGSTKWETTVSVLADMERIAQEYDTEIMFMVLPSIYQIQPDRLQWAQESFAIESHDVDLEQPYNRLQDAAETYDLTLFDLLAPMRIKYAAAPHVKLYGEVDTHLSSEGHRAVAEILLERIKTVLLDEAG